MSNEQYVPSPERFRFSIAHCSLLISGGRFRGSMRKKSFRRILPMNRLRAKDRLVTGNRHPELVREFLQRVEEAWPLTLDPSPRAIHVSRATARGEGRERGHSHSTVPGSAGNLSLVTGDFQRSIRIVSQSPVTSYKLQVTSLMGLQETGDE